MVSFNKSKRGASSEKVVRKRLASGEVREYRYSRVAKPTPPRWAADSVDALLLAYRAGPEWQALAHHTRTTYNIYLRVFDQIGAVRVADLKRRELLSIRDAIAGSRGAGAANGFLRAASALLSWALDRGWIEYSPLAGAKALDGGHLKAWTEAEVVAAVLRLPEAYRRVVVLGMHTGQRRGDMVRLTWAAYDGATIRLRQGKTGALMAIPVHPDLRRELDAWKAERVSPFVLTAPRGRPWTAPHLTREMGKLLKAMDLPGINVHGLRKLAATRLADAGCSPHEIAAITGHRSLSMVQLYTASADQERLAGAAVERLETARRKLRETGS